MLSLKTKSEKTNTKRLFIIVLVTVIGFVVAVLSCFIMSYYFGKSYPYDSIFFLPVDRYNDFFSTVRYAFEPYSSAVSRAGYFPFMYFTLIPFAVISHFTFPSPLPYTAFITYFLVFCVLYFVSGYSTLKDEKKFTTICMILILFALSFPFLYMIDRGNVEASVYIFVLLFVFFYRKKKFNISTVFLALAISCKFFPVIFAIIYIKDKKYKEFFKVACYSIIFSVGSFLLLKCDFRILLKNLNFFTQNYFVENWGLPFSHSLHTLIKSILAIFSQYKILSIEQISSVVSFEIRIYFYIALFFIAIITVYTIVFEKVAWRIVAMITISMLLFANISYDYRMIYLMIPIMLFIVSKEKLTDKSNIYYALLFGLMLIPKNYYITAYTIGDTANIGGIINPLLFIIMAASIMKQGLQRKKVIDTIKMYIVCLFHGSNPKNFNQ